MSLNCIQSWPEFILSYPLYFNFIHLSLPKINFILLSRNCVGTPKNYQANMETSYMYMHLIFTEEADLMIICVDI